MKRILKITAVIAVFAIALSLFTACGKDGASDSSQDNAKGADDTALSGGASVPESFAEDEYPVATLTMENGGVIVMELYPDVAPQSVYNFISLANSGFYDGLIFHRVISYFMIQGGCPEGTGFGGPGYCIKGEFAINGVENNISHKRGVLSMARASYSYDSAGSQFFICVEDSESLDGQYAAFGRVIEGMDVVDAIKDVPTDDNDKPLAEQKIATVRVDTKGINYPAPEKYPER